MPQAPRARLLVIDDHIEMARMLAEQLTDLGYAADVAGSGKDALALFSTRPFDIVITDLRMKDVDGFDILRAVQQQDPTLPVLIMTAFGAVDTAVEAIKRGAFHYLTKPFKLDELKVFVDRALEDRQLREQNQQLRRMMEEGSQKEMVGDGRAMRALRTLLERVAPSPAPVLIRGESGTGKELVARALHFGSPRRDKPFVAVNCTALPEHLLESELFGHLKGAYTGATTARRGLFVEADGGSLLLDEIGDMAPALQARLLRVMEDGEVRAVGSDVTRKVNVRVIAATHQDLDARVKQGAFRQDLLFRLNVVPVAIPPLRDRQDDIAQLAEHFLARARARNPSASVRAFSPALLKRMTMHPWPGNVRELQNVVERVVIVSTSETVDVEEFEGLVGPLAPNASPVVEARDRIIPLKQLETDYIFWAVQRCGGNKTRAAELLGIDVSTIHRRERERGGTPS